MVTITLKGLEMQAKYTNQSTVGSWKWIGIGLGTGSETDSSTALGSEITGTGGERATATLSYEADYKSVWTYTWTFTGALAIEECAIFDAISSGNMLMRHKFASTKNVATDETLQLTMKLTQSV